MPLEQRERCHDCAVLEGQLHQGGCDMERCAFCGGQRISCRCPERRFYPEYKGVAGLKNYFSMTHAERALAVGLPLDVYMHGLHPEQQAEWDRIEASKGRVPFIMYPNICRRCGALWPKMFLVPDNEWERYVQMSERDEMLCRGCYDQIKGYIDNPGE